MSKMKDYWAAKLADFGEAEHIMHSVALAGTVWFIAPEMLQVPRQCDKEIRHVQLGNDLSDAINWLSRVVREDLRLCEAVSVGI